jgi:RecB family exonuclease
MLIEGFDRQPPRSPAEYRVRWALEASHGRPSAGLPDELREQLRAAAAIARHRFHAKDFNAYDGRLTHPAVLADLSTRFGPDKVFSPTALERYVECPFRFYLEQVLRLEPLEDPREEVEHTRRGAAFHRALARLHAKLRDQQVHEPTPEVDEQLFAELDAAVEEYARRSSSPAAQMLWRLEGQRLRRSAGRYRAHWQKFQHPWRERSLSPRPHHLEVDFGLPADGGAEPVAPLVIIADGVEVRIGGRIDRVDVVELPDGGLGFWVIDYKTGKGLYYSASDLQSLRRLQLALYALAVERVLLADGSARPLGLAYWMVTEAGPKLVLPAGRQATAWLAAVDHWPRFRDRLEAWVAKLVGHVRAGEFPLKPRSEQCTETCPFGQVCRIAQSRSLEKLWDLPLPGEVLSPES